MGPTDKLIWDQSMMLVTNFVNSHSAAFIMETGCEG
jgi:hypothetical protein